MNMALELSEKLTLYAFYFAIEYRSYGNLNIVENKSYDSCNLNKYKKLYWQKMIHILQFMCIPNCYRRMHLLAFLVDYDQILEWHY